MTNNAIAIVDEYHRRFPARPGIPKGELSSRLKMGIYSSATLQRLINDGIITENGAVVCLPTHHIQLTPAQQAKIDTFLHSLDQNPYTPPSDLIPEPDLLNLLIEQHKVVKVSDSVVFTTTTYNEIVARVTSHIITHGKVTLAEVRDLFKTSRKYAQAILEHMDEKKITRRLGDERVLY